MIHGGNGVLPWENFLGNEGAEITDNGAHIAVSELVPGASECIGKLIGVLQEAPGNLLVGGIEAQSEVCRQHGRRMTLLRIMRIGDQTSARAVPGRPLISTGGAFGEFPFIAKQIFKKVVAPLCGGLGPGYFQTAGNGVGSFAGPIFVGPAEALLFDGRGFGFRAKVGGGSRAVCFAEGVASCNQCDGFLVVHGHAAERFPNVPGGSDGVGFAVWAFGVDVDQAHLNGGERILKFAIARVTFIAEPGMLRSPIHLFGFPDIRATAAKTKGFESHGFESDIAGENHEVGPGNLAAVFLFDRPEKAARFVEAHVVRPAIEWSEPLLACPGTAAAIADAVGAGAVPSHANEQAAVMAEIRRPPILRIGHERMKVFDHSVQVEGLEFLCVVEILTHGVRQRGVLVKGSQIQLIGPPFAVAGTGFSSRERALAFG